jgi:hypothetical protein
MSFAKVICSGKSNQFDYRNAGDSCKFKMPDLLFSGKCQISESCIYGVHGMAAAVVSV